MWLGDFASLMSKETKFRESCMSIEEKERKQRVSNDFRRELYKNG